MTELGRAANTPDDAAKKLLRNFPTATSPVEPSKPTVNFTKYVPVTKLTTDGPEPARLNAGPFTTLAHLVGNATPTASRMRAANLLFDRPLALIKDYDFASPPPPDKPLEAKSARRYVTEILEWLSLFGWDFILEPGLKIQAFSKIEAVPFTIRHRGKDTPTTVTKMSMGYEFTIQRRKGDDRPFAGPKHMLKCGAISRLDDNPANGALAPYRIGRHAWVQLVSQEGKVLESYATLTGCLTDPKTGKARKPGQSGIWTLTLEPNIFTSAQLVSRKLRQYTLPNMTLTETPDNASYWWWLDKFLDIILDGGEEVFADTGRKVKGKNLYKVANNLRDKNDPSWLHTAFSATKQEFIAPANHKETLERGEKLLKRVQAFIDAQKSTD